MGRQVQQEGPNNCSENVGSIAETRYEHIERKLTQRNSWHHFTEDWEICQGRASLEDSQDW